MMRILSGLISAAATSVVAAGVVAVSGDTSIEGGWGLMDAESPYEMQPVPPTELPVFTAITSWSTPLGEMTATDQHEVRTVGVGWGSWSHGYTGEVYFHAQVFGDVYTLPANTMAFDWYLEPSNFGLHEMSVTATDSSGATANITKEVEGNSGAAHFGFYTTDGTTLTSIEVSHSPGASGFGWAEARVGTVPAPGSLMLIGLGVCARRKRRR